MPNEERFETLSERKERGNEKGLDRSPDTSGEVKESEIRFEPIEAKHASLYERLLETVRSWTSSAPSTAAGADDDRAISFDASAIASVQDSESRVQKLLDLALVKGVPHAVSVARHIDAYTLDRTHDRLADELSEELKKRGLLSED